MFHTVNEIKKKKRCTYLFQYSNTKYFDLFENIFIRLIILEWFVELGVKYYWIF